MSILKSPKTADFSIITAKKSGNLFHYSGAVDSQNSFGALLRSEFTFIYDPTFGISELVFDGQKII